MFEIIYLDAYQQERSLTYQNREEFDISMTTCSTLPDYFKVKEVRYNGKDIGYTGLMGDLYRTLNQMDLAPFE